MERKLQVGIIGATGMVGQRLLLLLEQHPWFEVKVLAASKRSSGKTYEEAVEGRWKMDQAIPEKYLKMTLEDGEDVDRISGLVDFVFCAISLEKAKTKALEEAYAKAETPVISNNSANRGEADVPMLIPEINGHHVAVIETQKKRLGTQRGFIVVKSNCSIQSYVPALSALMTFEPEKILVCTYQAISGSGKSIKDCPEILDNVIPYIPGEEEKSESEPLKIWGDVIEGQIVSQKAPLITTQCIRVSVSDGHLAAVFVSFKKKPSKEAFLEAVRNYQVNPIAKTLPSAPTHFLRYMEEENRPQTKLDRDYEKGMGISLGRLREDTLFDYKFVCLSHNTLRGAAGGGVLSAEYLLATGYLSPKSR